MHILNWTAVSHWSGKFQGLGMGEGHPRMTLRLTGLFYEEKVEKHLATSGEDWELSCSQWGVLNLPDPSLFQTLPRESDETGIFLEKSTSSLPTTNYHLSFLDWAFKISSSNIQHTLGRLGLTLGPFTTEVKTDFASSSWSRTKRGHHLCHCDRS